MFWRGVLGYLPVNLVQAIAGFGAIVVFTRLLSPADYGAYALALSVTSLVHTCLFTWVEAALARFYAAEQDEAGKAALFGTVYRTFGLMAAALPLAAGYASIAFAIGIALFIGTMRVRSMLAISLLGAVVAGAVCIAFLAFARDAWLYDYTPIGERSVIMRLALITSANVLLVAWATGTLYWLAPWRRRAVASYGARRADGRSTMDRVIER